MKRNVYNVKGSHINEISKTSAALIFITIKHIDPDFEMSLIVVNTE